MSDQKSIVNMGGTLRLGNYECTIKKERWKKTAITVIKNQITIRTANTMRKILELCNK